MIVKITPRGQDRDLGNDYALLVALFNEWCFCDGAWGETNGGDDIILACLSLDDLQTTIAEICKKEKGWEPEMLYIQVLTEGFEYAG